MRSSCRKLPIISLQGVILPCGGFLFIFIRVSLKKQKLNDSFHLLERYSIDLFNKLLEGYDNLAMVSTLDARLGRMALRVAQSAKKDILAVLHCLPIPVAFEG